MAWMEQTGTVSLSAEPPTLPDRSTSSGRSATATAVLLVASWAVIVGVVVGVGWLLIHPLEGSVGEVDDDFAIWLAEQRTDELNDIANAGTFLGDTIVELVLAPIIAVGVWIWQRSVVPALFLALVACGMGGIYYITVNVDPRQRPPVEYLDPGLSPTHSYPSGHVGTSIALYGGTFVLAWTYARAARWWASPLLLVPLVVLVSRLYQGVHHISDVLVSLAYGSVWLGTVAALLLHSHSRRSPRHRTVAS